jgi:hypothetical protein
MEAHCQPARQRDICRFTPPSNFRYVTIRDFVAAAVVFVGVDFDVFGAV